MLKFLILEKTHHCKLFIHPNVTALFFLNLERFFDCLDPNLFVTIVLANPLGFKQNKRFIDVNLNRLFGENIRHQTNQYEYTLVQNLDKLISEADEVLDVHSTSAPTDSFAIPCGEKRSYDMAKMLPVKFVVEQLCDFIEGTTMTAVQRYKKIGSIVECGQHEEAQTIVNAKRCIQTFLTKTNPTLEKPTLLKCLGREFVKEGFQYCKQVRAFTQVEFGEIIAKDNHRELKCELQNCYLIMPTVNKKQSLLKKF